MNLELKQIEWSQVANQRLLVQHEKAAIKTGLSLELTHIVVRLDLDDEEWEDFTTNLTSFRLWLEGQGGNGIQDKVEYRKAVKVSGPDRTIYIDPQGGAHARFVGFPQEESCPVIIPASPAKNSKATTSGARATPRSRCRKGSSARSAAKNGEEAPTPAAVAATAAETTVIEPAASVEATTVPAATLAPKPQASGGSSRNEPPKSNASAAAAVAPAAVAVPPPEQTKPEEQKPSVPEPEPEQKAKKLTDLFELLDDNSLDSDW